MSRRILFPAAAAFLVATRLLASPSYPLVFQDELKLTSTPACTICHQGATGAGTVTTELGRALRSRGLVGGSNEQSLRTAIKALVAEGNPAIKPYVGGGGGAVVVSGPEYGCTYAPALASGSTWAGGVCFAFALAARRRRR
jgi:hypothetical protein